MYNRLRRSLLTIIVLAGISLWQIGPALAAEPTLTGLTLSPGVSSLTADQTTTFVLTGTYSDASSSIVTEKATWTVNGGGFTGIPGQKGLYTANAVGVWSVAASLDGLSASAPVTIAHGAPVSLTLMPTPASVSTDAAVPLRLFAQDADGNGWDVTNEAVWSTTEATGGISAAGYTPKTAGDWKLQATLGTLTISRVMTITSGAVQTITITSGAMPTVKVGETSQLQANAYDTDGNLITPVVTWAVTNPDVGTINTEGIFTAIEPGQTNIIVTAGKAQSFTPIVVQSASVIGTENDPEIVAVTKPVARTPRVAAEEIEKQPEVTTQTPAPVTASTQADTEENFPHPWVIVLILAHALLLAGYFTWLMRKPMHWWWTAPVITTGIFLAIYRTAFTQGTYLWWPWTIIGLTIVFISIYYQRYGPHEASPGSITSPPSTP